jgi:hypothetical protein
MSSIDHVVICRKHGYVWLLTYLWDGSSFSSGGGDARRQSKVASM